MKIIKIGDIIPLVDYTTISGFDIKVRPVPHLVLRDLVERFVMPQPPVKRDKSTGKETPDYTNPDYLQEVAAMTAMRKRATNDAVYHLGVILDGMIPPVDEWWDYAEKTNAFFGGDWLDGYEKNSPTDQDILFKKLFILTDTRDAEFVINNATVSATGVRSALNKFRSS